MMADNDTPVLTLVERLQHFEKHQVENGDEYGAEMLYHTIARIQSLEQTNTELRAEVERWRIAEGEAMLVVESQEFKMAELRAEVERLRDIKEPVYCPTCGSCGEEGCCPPDKCQAFPCLYGENSAQSYRELEDENERLQSAHTTVVKKYNLACAENERLSVRITVDGVQNKLDVWYGTLPKMSLAGTPTRIITADDLDDVIEHIRALAGSDG